MQCTEAHIHPETKKIIPHEYVAGICLHTVSDSTASFLEATFPYYQSQDYERSKHFSGERKSKKRHDHISALAQRVTAELLV